MKTTEEIKQRMQKVKMHLQKGTQGTDTKNVSAMGYCSWHDKVTTELRTLKWVLDKDTLPKL